MTATAAGLRWVDVGGGRYEGSGPGAPDYHGLGGADGSTYEDTATGRRWVRSGGAWSSGPSDADRVAELEQRVAELEAQVAAQADALAAAGLPAPLPGGA